MIKDIKNNKKILLLIVVLLIFTIGATLAYFQGQIGSGATANVTVNAKTTDVLTFSKGNDISITATQANFGSGAGNRTGSTTATASLRANNDSNSATQTYNVYFNITGNNFEYCELEPVLPGNLKNVINDNSYSDLVNYSNRYLNVNRLVNNYCDVQTPELLLTITNPNNQALTSISGLTYTTVNGVSGFDITTQRGLIQIASNYSITSNSSSTATNQTWTFTVTFVNLNSDQQLNTGKYMTARAVIQKEAITTAYWNDSFTGTYRYSYPLGQKSTNGTTWTSGSPTTYGSFALLQSNTSNFANSPVYIKTTTEHQACLYYNNHEFCISPNYWEGTIGIEVYDEAAGLATKNKLQADMETALGTSGNQNGCGSGGGNSWCDLGGFHCGAGSNGHVSCDSLVSNVGCGVNSDGTAHCWLSGPMV